MPLDLFSVSATVLGLGLLFLIGRWLISNWRAHQKLIKRWQRSSCGTTEWDRVTTLRRQMALHAVYLFIMVAVAFVAIKSNSVTPHGQFLLVCGLLLLPWVALVVFETKMNFDTARSRKEDPERASEEAAARDPVSTPPGDEPVPVPPATPKEEPKATQVH